MASIAQVSGAMEAVLTKAAASTARSSGFVRRESKLGGLAFAKTAVLGWLSKPDLSLSELSQVAASLGVGISPQGLDERLGPEAARFLKGLLEVAITELVSAEPVAIEVLRRFSAVAVDDSTEVALPDALVDEWVGTGERTGHNQSALKLQLRLDLLSGALTGPVLQDARAQDRGSALQSTPLPPRALRLADLGYFSLEVMSREDTAGVYWLSRLQVQTAVFDSSGKRRDLSELLPTDYAGAVDVPVSLGFRKQLPARLLAVRVPSDVAETRRRKLGAEARRKGQSVSQERLRLADWTILVTNVPVESLSVDEALVLARARWQIELLFKLWKSHGQIDQSRSHKPYRVLCELYAKLLAMLLQHWLLLVDCWSHPDRSLVKAAAAIRAHTALLIAAYRGCLPIYSAIQIVQDTISTGCRMNPRRRHPNTYQLLLNPTAYA